MTQPLAQADAGMLAALHEHVETVRALEAVLPALQRFADEAGACLHAGNKLILFGNGGSAADAQHIAAEFIGRFMKERASVPAIALTVNTSVLTALGNDYGFDVVFSRQIEGLARAGDIAVGISTSGRSGNVLNGLRAARVRGCTTVAFCGEYVGDMAAVSDIVIAVPSERTPRIQEAHILLWHVFCERVEQSLT